ETALRDAAEQLELPQPVLRVHEALREEEVLLRFRPDVRHAHRVAPDLDGRGDAVHVNDTVECGPRTAHVEHARHDRRRDDGDREADDDDETPHAPLSLRYAAVPAARRARPPYSFRRH